jgi:myo-inositol-1(or 4)-monophosphatase
MNRTERRRALQCAVKAARAAGKLMRVNLRAVKKINVATQHDIKLELDVRCQKLIEQTLRAAFPAIAILGEEGVLGNPESAARWVVDPIDGTVNFAYGIPHACVSIALQEPAWSLEFPVSGRRRFAPRTAGRAAAYRSLLGVVYDPFTDELWTAVRGEPARLNGIPIRVSDRGQLRQAIVALGFAKQRSTLNQMLPTFHKLIHRVRKIRIMGAAALSMVYVASGRMDAYVEYGLRLWDIAAGGLILECAGGDFWHRRVPGEHAYEIIANNGRLRRQLHREVTTGRVGLSMMPIST